MESRTETALDSFVCGSWKLTTTDGEQEQRLWVSINWDLVPLGKNTKEPPLGHDYQLIPPAYKVNGSVVFSSVDTTITIGVSTFNPKFKELEDYEGFVEGNGYVSINAENASSRVAGKEAEWELFGGLGYSGNVARCTALSCETSNNSNRDKRTKSDVGIRFLHLQCRRSRCSGYRPCRPSRSTMEQVFVVL